MALTHLDAIGNTTKATIMGIAVAIPAHPAASSPSTGGVSDVTGRRPGQPFVAGQERHRGSQRGQKHDLKRCRAALDRDRHRRNLTVGLRPYPRGGQHHALAGPASPASTTARGRACASCSTVRSRRTCTGRYPLRADSPSASSGALPGGPGRPGGPPAYLPCPSHIPGRTSCTGRNDDADQPRMAAWPGRSCADQRVFRSHVRVTGLRHPQAQAWGLVTCQSARAKSSS
jgi:hypothetical protein